MAGKIIADIIESAGSQISLNVGNVTILTASSTGLTLTPTSNVNINLTNSIVTLTNGSATSPGLTFSGNTRTGLFMPAANTLAFTAANTESMRIDSAGNVGIGTNSPSARLHVDSGSTADGFRLNSTTTSVFNSWFLSSTRKAYFLVDSSGILIDSEAASTSQRFATQGTERMRIASGGEVLVGTTSSTVSGQTPKFGVVGSNSATIAVDCTAAAGASGVHIRRSVLGTGEVMTFDSLTTRVGSISITGSATAYNTSSDYRLKNTISPMAGALAKVALLKPCTYKWNADGSDGQGFIAHELAEVCPNAVTGEKDAVDEKGDPKYQQIDVSFLVATLTAAIQELKVIVDAQAVEIAALKAK